MSGARSLQEDTGGFIPKEKAKRHALGCSSPLKFGFSWASKIKRKKKDKLASKGLSNDDHVRGHLKKVNQNIRLDLALT